MLIRMKLDPAKERLVYRFFERYLRLTQEEEEILLKEIRQGG
ncbi:hypothetical protein [Gracilibacillus alcaliphilus]|nr:hypothetical protein [Gracilibacillus alcaliphilus]